jgi:polysaccharide deacetylase family protein (PEP-CTERM system associated)
MTVSAETVVNAFSVDVEGFIEANLEGFPSAVAARCDIRPAEDDEIRRNTFAILEWLEHFDVRGTFFFLGRIARDAPDIVRAVADARHEIACHSDEHCRVFGLTPDRFRAALDRAKRSLEDTTGCEVVGFRAPDFSITNESLWALDVLVESGIRYDSSVYPFGMHDVYGIAGSRTGIHRHPNGLIEFPLSTITLFGRQLPFGGGGYFRFYPIGLTRRWMRRANASGVPVMFYIHPYELGEVVPRVDGLPLLRRLRHYYGCGQGIGRLSRLFEAFRFAPARDVIRAFEEHDAEGD